MTRIFANPSLVPLLAVVPLLTGLFIWCWWRRRRALAALGLPSAVRRLTSVSAGVRRWRWSWVMSGVFCLALACAGPQWGTEAGESLPGRSDLAVVLDLSRSMRAEQPSRVERSLRLLRNLAATLERRGGRRVALVAFAGKARLLFPLTQDWDHFRFALKQIETDDLPSLEPDSEAQARSGTRIGAGLTLAVEALGAAKGGTRALLLLSDGDDPADDQEWQEGVTRAHEAGVRVHTVGVGDPDEPRKIPAGAGYLEFAGKPVTTRLNEPVMQEIARRTGGTYLPARTHALPLGALVEELLEQPAPPTAADPDGLPVFTQRYAWFLSPALFWLLATLLLNEGPARVREIRNPKPEIRNPRGSHDALVKLGAALLFVILISAAPTAGSVDELIRAGNVAFARQEFDAALKLYTQAEERASDPGLVAFNKASACYRLGLFGEAATGYRRCLEDDRIPAERRPRASYDLGNALLKQAGENDVVLLAEAMQSYRRCLARTEADAELRADARHNLEIAHRRWREAAARNPNQQEPPDDDPPEHDPRPPRKDGGKEQKPGNGAKEDKGPGHQEAGDDGGDDPGGDPKGQGAKAGPIQVLPDQDQVKQLRPDELDRHLDDLARRIAADRRAFYRRAVAPAGVKNW